MADSFPISFNLGSLEIPAAAEGEFSGLTQRYEQCRLKAVSVVNELRKL